MIAQLIVLASLFGSVAEEKTLINHILEAKTEKHWIQDRKSDKNMISSAATGVGFYAFARGSQLGLLSKATASAWIRDGFTYMIDANFENDGWIYHFVDRAGKAYKNSEVSSIDSVLFYLGAERAAELLQDHELLKYIRGFKEKISIAVMTDSEDDYFYHGWVMENGRRKMLKSKWKHYNEGILIYKYFDRPFKPVHTHYDLPLFCYFYPLAFYPDEISWMNHLGRAIDFQSRITGRFGYSAMDGENGYGVNSPYYVSPLAVRSCMKFFPSKCRRQLDEFNVDVLTPSISVDGSWKTKDRVFIDDGIALMLLYKE